jgi:hypothetical protein
MTVVLPVTTARPLQSASATPSPNPSLSDFWTTRSEHVANAPQVCEDADVRIGRATSLTWMLIGIPARVRIEWWPDGVHPDVRVLESAVSC